MTSVNIKLLKLYNPGIQSTGQLSNSISNFFVNCLKMGRDNKNIRQRLVLFSVSLFMGCTSRELIKVDVAQKENFSGILQYEMFYGAPGFGEDTASDEKEPAYIRYAAPPFLFRDTILASDYGVSLASCSYDTVKTIQIRVDPHSNPYANNLKNMVGKKVTLTCTLYGAYNGHHHAPALTEKVYAIKE
ncbi:MAG: DUF4431 domain-containing protein [Bacteroidota bacterium]